ncbi:MAG TPA: PAS domain S-box protein [Phycisphaerae bacterium]|nr:PAS domain S-box protein [Phycisphaerae bacterium]HRR84236.1 PAS domain S-box protein [Phycisphaerae bacterium]
MFRRQCFIYLQLLLGWATLVCFGGIGQFALAHAGPPRSRPLDDLGDGRPSQLLQSLTVVWIIPENPSRAGRQEQVGREEDSARPGPAAIVSADLRAPLPAWLERAGDCEPVPKPVWERLPVGRLLRSRDELYVGQTELHGLDDRLFWWVLLVVALAIVLAICWNRTPCRDSGAGTVAPHGGLGAERLDDETTRETARRFRAIFDQSLHLTGVMDPQGTLLDVNSPAAEFSGVSREELLHKPFWEGPWWRHDSAARSQVREAIARVAHDGEPVRFQTTHVDRDGRLHNIQFSLRAVRDDIGRIALLIAEGLDITDLKRSEQAAQDGREWYRSLFEGANDAIFLMEEDRFVDCNPRTQALFGGTREQILQLHPYDLSPEFQPDGRPSTQKALEKISAAYAGEPQSFEWRHYRIDGSLFDAAVTLNRVFLAGRPHLVAVVRDITGRKRADEALRNEMAFSQTLIHASPAFFVAIGADGRTRMMNPAMLNALGYTAEEVVGKDYMTTFVPDADRGALARIFEQLVVAGRPTLNENHIMTKDGRLLLVEWHGAPVFKGQELDYFFGVGIDITRRRQAEEEIRKLNAELEQRVRDRTAQLAAANAALNEFAYVVSHDLKAPLRAVSQLAQWVSEDYASVLDEEGKNRLKLINGRIARMYNLIDGILQYSRIGRVEEDRRPIDLDLLVREVIEALSPPAHVHVTVEGRLPVVVADRTQMTQVFQNLIGNAIKFINKPAGLVTVACEDAGDRWRFSVTDNGPGIDPKYHEKIFGIFQTLTPRDQQEGTGIGLTLVRRIVELYSGKVELESEVGKGSTFTFTLPK